MSEQTLTPKQLADQEKRNIAKETWDALPPTWVLQNRIGEAVVRASSGQDFRLKGQVIWISQFGIVLFGRLPADQQDSNYFIPWESICFFKED